MKAFSYMWLLRMIRTPSLLPVAVCFRSVPVCYLSDVIKLQLVDAGLVECLLEVVAQTVDGDREEDIAQLKTASDLMVLLLLGGKQCRELQSISIGHKH